MSISTHLPLSFYSSYSRGKTFIFLSVLFFLFPGTALFSSFSFGSLKPRPFFCPEINKFSESAISYYFDISKGLALGSFKEVNGVNLEKEAQYCLVQMRVELSDKMLTASMREYNQFFIYLINFYNNKIEVDKNIIFPLLQGLQNTWMDHFAQEYMKSPGQMLEYTTLGLVSGILTILVIRNFSGHAKAAAFTQNTRTQETQNALEINVFRNFISSMKKALSTSAKQFILPRLNSLAGTSLTNYSYVTANFLKRLKNKSKREALETDLSDAMEADNRKIVSILDYPSPYEYFKQDDFTHLTHEDFAMIRGVIAGALSAPIGIEVAEAMVIGLSKISKSFSKVSPSFATLVISTLLTNVIYYHAEKLVNFGSEAYFTKIQDDLHEKINTSISEDSVYDIFSGVEEHVYNVFWNINIKIRKFRLKLDNAQFGYLYDVTCNSWDGLLSFPSVNVDGLRHFLSQSWTSISNSNFNSIKWDDFANSSFTSSSRIEKLRRFKRGLKENLREIFSEFHSGNRKYALAQLQTELSYVQSINRDFLSNSVSKIEGSINLFNLLSSDHISDHYFEEIYGLAREMMGTDDNGNFLIEGGVVTPEIKQDILQRFHCPDIAVF